MACFSLASIQLTGVNAIGAYSITLFTDIFPN